MSNLFERAGVPGLGGNEYKVICDTPPSDKSHPHYQFWRSQLLTQARAMELIGEPVDYEALKAVKKTVRDNLEAIQRNRVADREQKSACPVHGG